MHTMPLVMNPFQISPLPAADHSNTMNATSTSSSPSSFDRLILSSHDPVLTANPSPSPPPPQNHSTGADSSHSTDPMPVNGNHSVFPSELHSLADQMLADNYFAMNPPPMNFAYASAHHTNDQSMHPTINPNDPVMEIPADSPPSTQSSPDIKMELNHADGGQSTAHAFDTQFNMDVARAHEFSSNQQDPSSGRFHFSARALHAVLNSEDNMQFKPHTFTRQPPQNNGMGGGMSGMSNFDSLNHSLSQLDQFRPFVTQAAYNVIMPSAVRPQRDYNNQRFYGPIRPSLTHSEPMIAKRVGSALSLPDTHRGYVTSPTHSSSPASEGSRQRVPYHRLTPTQNFKPFDPSPTGNSVKLKRYFCEDCGKGFTQKGGLINHARIHRGERPYVCSHPDCGRAFVQKCNLTRHERVHTGEKPYQCPVRGCTKQFNRKHGLTQHLAVAHEIIEEEENSMDMMRDGMDGMSYEHQHHEHEHKHHDQHHQHQQQHHHHEQQQHQQQM